MITKDLKYCCPWAFFKLYTNAAVIADRLGVTDRAVRKARAQARTAGCTGCPKCLKRQGLSRLQEPPPAGPQS